MNQVRLAPGPNNNLALQGRKNVVATVAKVENAIRNLKGTFSGLRTGVQDRAIEAGHSARTEARVQELSAKVDGYRAKFDTLTSVYRNANKLQERIEILRERALRGTISDDLEKRAHQAAVSVFETLLDELPEFYKLLRLAGVDIPRHLENAMEQAAATVRDAPESQFRSRDETPQPHQRDLKVSINELRAEIDKADQHGKSQAVYISHLVQDLAKWQLVAQQASSKQEQTDEELKELRKTVSDYENELIRLRMFEKDQDLVPDLQAEIVDQNEAIADLRKRLEESNSNLQQALEDANLATSKSKLRIEKLEADAIEHKEAFALKGQEVEKQALELNNRSSRLKQQAEDISHQKLTLQRQLKDFGRQGELLKEKTKAADQATNTSLALREQIQRAITLIRLVSIGSDSDIWRVVVENVHRDPMMAPGLRPKSRPWTIVSSWATDVTLAIRPDDHGLHGIALDILAILRSGSPPSRMDLLLSRLHGLQEALADGLPCLACITKMLLDFFTSAVSQPGFHLTHRLAMCQVVALCAGWTGNEDRLNRFFIAVKAADPRAADLFEALQNWNGVDQFPLADCLTFPEQNFVLVGFRSSPPGILAVGYQAREIVWVGSDFATHNLIGLTLSSPTGQIMSLPIEAAGCVWAVQNI